MYVIGLTGGIASGKSLVAGFLRQLGAEIINADVIGHQVIRPGLPGYLEILEAFGDSILEEDGAIDRKKLGAVVFACPEKLKLLNRITHPRIFSEIAKLLKTRREQAFKRVVVVEAALLFEIGLDALVDEIWIIQADPEVRVKRIMERDGLTEEEAWERVQSQVSSWRRIADADRVVYNNSDVEKLFRDILEIWESNPE